MKLTLVALMLWLAASSTCFAQQTAPSPANSVGAYQAGSVSDSTRQVLHRLFKRGRLYGTIGAVAGGMVVAGATSYVARGEGNWQTGIDYVLGTSALASGLTIRVLFSRRNERKLLEDLAQGKPLPDYVVQWLPFAQKRKK
ncbi:MULTISPECIES: hypothetical protein [Hymenobacter]|uniref:Transmembrane protein n=1 Tax=Hymenobacter mucosus TaxID=1411120 RepID=A0A238ZSM5_9BACT|nr:MULTISPECIES: hypothetical protein [Hymenobacter]SNR86446.1 hypothetical protein SAMN06269173_109118 [Hymenobacter mucosus]